MIPVPTISSINQDTLPSVAVTTSKFGDCRLVFISKIPITSVSEKVQRHCPVATLIINTSYDFSFSTWQPGEHSLLIMGQPPLCLKHKYLEKLSGPGLTPEDVNPAPWGVQEGGSICPARLTHHSSSGGFPLPLWIFNPTVYIFGRQDGFYILSFIDYFFPKLFCLCSLYDAANDIHSITSLNYGL